MITSYDSEMYAALKQTVAASGPDKPCKLVLRIATGEMMEGEVSLPEDLPGIVKFKTMVGLGNGPKPPQPAWMNITMRVCDIRAFFIPDEQRIQIPTLVRV